MSEYAEPKFKEGQVVRVLPVETGYYKWDSFEEEMLEYVGKEFEIDRVRLYDDHCIYQLKTGDGRSWTFQEDWLEAV